MCRFIPVFLSTYWRFMSLLWSGEICAVAEATARFVSALAFSICADSILFPLLLPSLLSAWGYTGLWVGKGLCIVITFVLYYIIVCIVKRTPAPASDDMLQIPARLRKQAPMIDISLNANNANASGIAKRIRAFLNEYGVSKKLSYMTALCTEELAADFVAHMETEDIKHDEIMDIKLFVDEDSITIIIRNAAKRYNPLDFTLDNETFSKIGVYMAQKIARKIEYDYIYKLNVVTIALDRITDAD